MGESGTPIGSRRAVSIGVGHATLVGDLMWPSQPVGLVLFAHGSGSGRLSPRNQSVASTLNGFGLATLLFDLLTADEEAIDEVSRQFRFDIALLSDRLVAVTDWCLGQEDLAALPLGYFGASTGAAAALIAAARRRDVVRAVVSRGGRPDLAGDALPRVKAATLMIVGSLDEPVIQLNRIAARRLTCEHQIQVVPGASHLFPEPGKLAVVAGLAGEWFTRQFGQIRPSAA